MLLIKFLLVQYTQYFILSSINLFYIALDNRKLMISSLASLNTSKNQLLNRNLTRYSNKIQSWLEQIESTQLTQRMLLSGNNFYNEKKKFLKFVKRSKSKKLASSKDFLKIHNSSTNIIKIQEFEDRKQQQNKSKKLKKALNQENLYNKYLNKAKLNKERCLIDHTESYEQNNFQKTPSKGKTCQNFGLMTSYAQRENYKLNTQQFRFGMKRIRSFTLDKSKDSPKKIYSNTIFSQQPQRQFKKLDNPESALMKSALMKSASTIIRGGLERSNSLNIRQKSKMEKKVEMQIAVEEKLFKMMKKR